MENFTTAVAVAFVVGTVVGAVGWVGFGAPLGQADSDPGPDPESPPVSVGKSGGGCLDTRANAGWVHEVAVGHSFAVTLNATVVHERGQTVDATVTQVTPGAYRIDLRTVAEEPRTSDERKSESPPEGCRVATDLRLSASLPTDYRSFEVTIDGRTLLTAENEDTTADLYRLPNPINATTSAAATSTATTPTATTTTPTVTATADTATTAA
ncbi:hypothetical protein M0R88_16430 [Halorussus gelatinilyticus]|uniref:Uncharacterized protein n=1 Tax=Halorussus gelatinilyticus TaxID=2937524 RepID=A0A8U0IGT3_9EURY|nr:hypothetical protein [Halorussus gelatinilyticus]UPW00088.1 hypothetical protein M0R88_16430 [Halorussus gelatinilyticus]